MHLVMICRRDTGTCSSAMPGGSDRHQWWQQWWRPPAWRRWSFQATGAKARALFRATSSRAQPPSAWVRRMAAAARRMPAHPQAAHQLCRAPAGAPLPLRRGRRLTRRARAFEPRAAVSSPSRRSGEFSVRVVDPLALVVPPAAPGNPLLDRTRPEPGGEAAAAAAATQQPSSAFNADVVQRDSGLAAAAAAAGGASGWDSAADDDGAALESAAARRWQQHAEQQHDQQQQQHGEEAAAGPAPTSLLQGDPAEPGGQSAALWTLGLLTLGYLHLSVTIYALPSMLPFIAEDMSLNDIQGAWLTTGYTILYGLALVPAGLLADTVNRPRLVAGGMAMWSLLTMAASSSMSFGQLMAARVGFAASQGMLHPAAYSILPELFPNNRTAAMAVYNSSIYLGRALAFAVVVLAGHQVMADGDVAAWRPLLWWLGPPGIALAAFSLLGMQEPRQRSSSGNFLPLVTMSTDSDSDSEGPPAIRSPLAAAREGPIGPLAGLKAPRQLVSAPEAAAPTSLAEKLVKLRELVSDPAFQALTAAAAFGDVASWALIGWQSVFYERVYELEPAVYAPAAAGIICVGGMLGGVGAAVFGDRLTQRGARAWLTAGTSLAAVPLVAASFLVPDYRVSFAALLVGYALSECWRSPVAVMIREVAPAGLGSTASAVHLCCRGLAGALGPMGIAALSGQYGLQMAMLLIPACHLAAGVGLAATEGVIESEKEKLKASRHGTMVDSVSGSIQ